MVRRFVLAASAALAASVFAFAPSAAADGEQPQPTYNGDVPGINYEAYLSAPCFQWDRFIFGRGPDGQAMACHWIPNQGYLGWDSPSPPFTGFWVISPKLYGVQTAGAPCPGSQAAAQSPDGLPMVCMGAQGWQEGVFRSGFGANGRVVTPPPTP